MRTRESGRIVQSSSLTLEILDAVTQLEGARVSQIADHVDVSESTASNHLHTLRRAEFLTADGDIYHPSLKLAKLGEYAKTRDPAYRHAIQVANELDGKTNFETSVTVEENGLGRYLRPEVDATTEVDNYFTVGEPMYLHTTAAGKAILATYPEERVDFVVDRWGLPAQTPQTITSREALNAELDAIRDQGYALNRGEDQEGVYAIGQVATKPSGAVLGAMSIAGPTYRTKQGRFEERFADVLDGHIERLEARLE